MISQQMIVRVERKTLWKSHFEESILRAPHFESHTLNTSKTTLWQHFTLRAPLWESHFEGITLRESLWGNHLDYTLKHTLRESLWDNHFEGITLKDSVWGNHFGRNMGFDSCKVYSVMFFWPKFGYLVFVLANMSTCLLFHHHQPQWFRSDSCYICTSAHENKQYANTITTLHVQFCSLGTPFFCSHGRP